MSLILRHAIKIDAPLEVVFLALSQVKHIAAWHHGPVQGDLAVGEVLYINPSSDLKFGWKTNEIVGRERIAQECVEGPEGSLGKQVVYTLSSRGPKSTLLELTDGQWNEGDGHLASCNTHWGGALYRLKAYIELEMSGS